MDNKYDITRTAYYADEAGMPGKLLDSLPTDGTPIWRCTFLNDKPVQAERAYIVDMQLIPKNVPANYYMGYPISSYMQDANNTHISWPLPVRSEEQEIQRRIDSEIHNYMVLLNKELGVDWTDLQTIRSLQLGKIVKEDNPTYNTSKKEDESTN